MPALIVLLVLLSFLPLLGNDFVDWDDWVNLTHNPHQRGLSVHNLRWMFTTLHMGHYQPLTWLTHAVVYSIWGLNPVAYHLGNLLLHAANAVLLYAIIVVLLRQSSLIGGSDAAGLRVCVAAAVGALFFAIHPLRVESVAWATERRDVLGGLFILLAVLTYLRAHSDESLAEAVRRRWYRLSVASFALSLLCKVSGMMLPLVLLLMDAYPLGRFSRAETRLRTVRCAVREKVPYAVCALAVAPLALHAQPTVPLAMHGVIARVMQAAYGLCFYVWKTVVPVQLSPLYPLDLPLDTTQPRYFLSVLAVLAVGSSLLLLRRRCPWALAACTSYALLVSPVLGLAHAGPQIAADRYSYLPCLPWAVLVAAGIDRLWLAWDMSGRRTVLACGLVALVAVGLVTLGTLTAQQTRVWRDSLTLWNQVLHLQPSSPLAYRSRGEARWASKDIDGAVADYTQAISLDPNYADAYTSLGLVRYAQGDLEGALADFDAALRCSPQQARAYSNRGIVRRAKGDLNGALADYNRALEIDPEHRDAYYNRGNLRRAQGDMAGAVADFTAALHIDPDYVEAYRNRGDARQALGDLPGAIDDFSHALLLQPDNPDLLYNRGNARKASGDFHGAIADYTAAIRLSPDDPTTYNNRGNARKMAGDLTGAVADFRHALRLAPHNALFARNLALALQQLAQDAARQ